MPRAALKSVLVLLASSLWLPSCCPEGAEAPSAQRDPSAPASPQGPAGCPEGSGEDAEGRCIAKPCPAGSQRSGDLCVLIPPAPTFELRPGATLQTARTHHTATLLEDGRVLVAGGKEVEATPHGALDKPLGDTEVYDPIEGVWKRSGRFGEARSHHTATRLIDGRVLVCGGLGGRGPLRSVDLLDAEDLRWSAAPPLAAARFRHTATRLDDGRVLVVGGDSSNLVAVQEVEIFDPNAASWRPAASMA